MGRFEDYSVLVTGASSGIGLASAQLFAQEGARVGMIARHEDRLKLAVESLAGDGHWWKACDLTIEEDVEKRGTKEYHHKIILEINNFDSKDLKLKVMDTKYPDRTEVKYDTPPSEEVGKTVIWEITVPAKGNKKINYEFYSDSCYSEPYGNY